MLHKNIAVLTFLSLFTLTSCNNTEPKTKDGKTIITFWHTHNDDESKTLKEIIAEYETINSDIKVALQQVPFSDAQNKYKTVAQAKNAPDIFKNCPFWVLKQKK